MTTLGKSSPHDLRRDNTTWVRDLKTGDVVATSSDERELAAYLGHIINHTKIDEIEEGYCEGVEVIYVQTYHGEPYDPMFWIDHGGSFTTDDVCDALFPMHMAAE